jgi:hypothetical protein
MHVGPILVEVVLGNVKNVNLTVRRQSGAVRLSAPRRMRPEAIRAFVLSKVSWIERHQAKARAQPPPRAAVFVDGERHDVWGRPHLLTVTEAPGRSTVECEEGRMRLTVAPGANVERRRTIVAGWQREEVRRAATPLISRWESRLGVEVNRWFVRRMTTRWGSCNPLRGHIRFNSALAAKPPDCLEYVVVHELAHLLVPRHDARFYAVMDRHLPGWRTVRRTLDGTTAGDLRD